MVATNAELMGQTLDDIADAIREKRGIFYDIPMLEMADEIRRISGSEDSYIMVRIPQVGNLTSPQMQVLHDNVDTEYVIEMSSQVLSVPNEINVFIDEE